MHYAYAYQIILADHQLAALNVYMMKIVQQHWHAFVISVKVLVTEHVVQMHIVQFCIISLIVFVMKVILAIHILDADLLSNVSQLTNRQIAETGFVSLRCIKFDHTISICQTGLWLISAISLFLCGIFSFLF